MGFIGVIFKNFINIDLFSYIMEYVVGFTLILIGLIGIQRSKNFKNNGGNSIAKQHTSSFDIESNHSLMNNNNINYSHNNSIYSKIIKKFEYSSFLTILITGIFHGLSGTGHILGVIPALTFNNIKLGALYLFSFCLGTMISMSIFTMFFGVIGLIIKNNTAKSSELPKKISFCVSLFALFVGILWIIQPLYELIFQK